MSAGGLALYVPPPPTGLSSRYYDVNGDQVLEMSSADGYFDITLYKHYPSKLWPKNQPNPAQWSGTEFRKDNTGRRWSSLTPAYVMDDFGNLVEVPK